MSNKLRVRFCKKGKAKYISHLDLSATIQRAFLRAGVKLKYSEGFNPHPYISVALPLKVGDESICELLDFAPDESFEISEDLPARLTEAMPEGIEVFEIYRPERKFSEIAWVEISGILIYDSPRDKLVDAISERLFSQSIIISKKSKSGIKDIDIAPFIKDIEINEDKNIKIKAKISAFDPSLSPENLMSAFSGEFADLMPDFYNFSRIELYGESMEVFR